MYVEATGRAEGDVTMLKSSDFLAVSTRCMEFYYHMGGADVGTLEVQVWPDSSSSPSIQVVSGIRIAVTFGDRSRYGPLSSKKNNEVRDPH